MKTVKRPQKLRPFLISTEEQKSIAYVFYLEIAWTMERLEFIQLLLVTILFSLIFDLKRIDYELSKHLYFTLLFLLSSGFIVELFLDSRNH